MAKVYQITPMDNKGEQDGNPWITDSEEIAVKYHYTGNTVKVMEGEFHPITVEIKKKKPE